MCRSYNWWLRHSKQQEIVNTITLSYLENCGINSIFPICLFAQRVDEEIEELLAVFLLVLLVGLGAHKFQGF